MAQRCAGHVEKGVNEQQRRRGKRPGAHEDAAVRLVGNADARDDVSAERDGSEKHGQRAEFHEPLQPTALGMEHDGLARRHFLIDGKNLREGADAVPEKRRVFPHAQRILPDVDAHEIRDIAAFLRGKARDDLRSESQPHRAQHERRARGDGEGADAGKAEQHHDEKKAEAEERGDEAAAGLRGEQAGEGDEGEHHGGAHERIFFPRAGPAHAARAEHHAHREEAGGVVPIRERAEADPAGRVAQAVDGLRIHASREEGDDRDEGRGGEHSPDHHVPVFAVDGDHPHPQEPHDGDDAGEQSVERARGLGVMRPGKDEAEVFGERLAPDGGAEDRGGTEFFQKQNRDGGDDEPVSQRAGARDGGREEAHAEREQQQQADLHDAIHPAKGQWRGEDEQDENPERRALGGEGGDFEG